MTPASRRIGQLIRLLSSPQPGEAGAAAAALNRALTSAGLDIHQLAEVAEAGLATSAVRPVARPTERGPAAAARRPDGCPIAVNETLVCDEPGGIFRACGCGSILFTVIPGVGPHAAQLVCDACGQGGRWLSRSRMAGSAPETTP
jgi:hypothetical protein